MERGERGEKGEEGHSGMCGRGEGTKLRGDDDVGVGRYKCLCSLVGSGLAYLLLLPPSPFTLPLTSFPLTPSTLSLIRGLRFEAAKEAYGAQAALWPQHPGGKVG